MFQERPKKLHTALKFVTIFVVHHDRDGAHIV
jgi:hypothetical protein